MTTLIGSLALASPLVPTNYDLVDLPEPIALSGISAAPGLIVVDMRGQLALVDAQLTVSLELDDQGRQPGVKEFGPELGTRVTDRPALGVDGVVDFFSREVLVADDYGIVVPDIDGNGLPDLHGFEHGVYLQQPDLTWRSTTYPVPQKPSKSSNIRFRAVGDTNGDGFADVLFMEDTEPVNQGYVTLRTAGHLELFRGGPDGYEPTPAWTLDVDAPVADAVAIQNDDDPELELLLLGADNWATHYSWAELIQFYVLDVQEDAPTATAVGPVFEDTRYNGVPPHIETYDDVDGDGREDVIFFVSAGVTGILSTAMALSSAASWNPEEPAFVLTPWAKDGEVIDHRVTGDPTGDAIADIDGDGHLDIVQGHRLDSTSSYMYIWYPLREDSPKDTGLASATDATAHTGTTPDDTRPAGATTETGAETPTEPTSDASADASGCGCTTGPTPTLALLPLLAAVLRRRGDRP